jgi:hypothetical protein
MAAGGRGPRPRSILDSEEEEGTQEGEDEAKQKDEVG